MIKINEDDKAFLLEIIPEVEQVLGSDNVDDVLIPLHEWIALNGYVSEGDEEYVLSPLGRKSERMYDRIYYNN